MPALFHFLLSPTTSLLGWSDSTLDAAQAPCVVFVPLLFRLELLATGRAKFLTSNLRPTLPAKIGH